MSQNLLSKQHKKELKAEYIFRLVTIASIVLSTSVLVGVVALLPTYIHVIDELGLYREEQSEKEQENHENKELANELDYGVYILDLLEVDLKKEKFSTLINEVLEERPNDIRIIGLTYDRNNKRATFKGIADTRDLVVPFSKKIESNPSFSEATVPISDLASNVDVVFNLRISIKDDVEE